MRRKMKIRIRETYEVNKAVYKVQVKRGLFWKTVEKYVHLEDAIKFADNLKKMDEYNNPKPKNPTYTFTAWATRNYDKRTGPYRCLGVFTNLPEKKNTEYGLQWHSDREGYIPFMEIRLEKLFGKENISDPTRVKVTIEKID
jgi:thymidylate synthase